MENDGPFLRASEVAYMLGVTTGRVYQREHFQQHAWVTPYGFLGLLGRGGSRI
jgi:hypothetical protein